MIRLAGLDLFSVLDTPVCFDQSNEFSAAVGGLALWLAAWRTVASLREAGDRGSDTDDRFLESGVND